MIKQFKSYHFLSFTVILAMRRAHKQELEKSGESQHLRESADITQLQDEYEWVTTDPFTVFVFPYH